MTSFQTDKLDPWEIEVYPHELKTMAQYAGTMCFFIFSVMREQGFCTVKPRDCAEFLRISAELYRLVEFAEEAEGHGHEYITLYPF